MSCFGRTDLVLKKALCKNHPARFWPVLPSGSRPDANQIQHVYWDKRKPTLHKRHLWAFPCPHLHLEPQQNWTEPSVTASLSMIFQAPVHPDLTFQPPVYHLLCVKCFCGCLPRVSSTQPSLCRIRTLWVVGLDSVVSSASITVGMTLLASEQSWITWTPPFLKMHQVSESFREGWGR